MLTEDVKNGRVRDYHTGKLVGKEVGRIVDGKFVASEAETETLKESNEYLNADNAQDLIRLSVESSTAIEREYVDMTMAELKKEAKAAGLTMPRTAKKSEYIDALSAL